MAVVIESRGAPAWRVLLAYLRPHWWALLGGGLLGLLTGATGLALPLVARSLIGSLAQDQPVTAALVGLTALVLSNAVIGAVSGYLLQRTAQSVVLTARYGLVGRLLRLKVEAVDRSEPGDLMSRVTADTTLLSEATTSSLVGGVTGALTLVATVIMMALTDWVLLAVTAVALVLAGSVIGLVVPRINQAARRAQESVGSMGRRWSGCSARFAWSRHPGPRSGRGNGSDMPPHWPGGRASGRRSGQRWPATWPV